MAGDYHLLDENRGEPAALAKSSKADLKPVGEVDRDALRRRPGSVE
jgi:hypothetical protein